MPFCRCNLIVAWQPQSEFKIITLVYIGIPSSQIIFSSPHNITALYARLSQEDALDRESNSIANQKKVLLKYATDNGFSNPTFFIDDGVSGVTFDRPGWNGMIRLAEVGKVKTVIVKDMSRMGRDYLKVQAEKRMAELDRIFKRIYEDDISGSISHEGFLKLSAEYEAEQKELTEAVIRKYVGITELTPTIVNEFVKKMIVHAPDKFSGHRRQKIQIIWNFVGELKQDGDGQTIPRQRKSRTA